jgi:hypothetical protein
MLSAWSFWTRYRRKIADERRNEGVELLVVGAQSEWKMARDGPSCARDGHDFVLAQRQAFGLGRKRRRDR